MSSKEVNSIDGYAHVLTSDFTHLEFSSNKIPVITYLQKCKTKNTMSIARKRGLEK